jgi:hypothetical protein
VVAGFELTLAGASRRKLRAPTGDGSVVVDKLRDGRYTLSVTSDPGIGTAEVTLEPGASRSVELNVRRWAVVRGRLVDADGRPLAGLQVLSFANGGSVDFGTQRIATTDADGRFELTRVDPQSNFLLVKSPASTMQTLALQAAPGEQRDLGTVTVRLDATVRYESPGR